MKPLFIDIGSHDGTEIKWALNHGYDVHAFEPNLKMREFLLPYEDLAKINYAAAWNVDGVAKLYKKNMEWDNDQGFSLIPDKTNLGEEFDLVPTINIGRYLTEWDRDVEILKIDAEGAEYIILESVLNHFDIKRVKHIMVEDHSGFIFNWHDHKKQVLEKFEKRGIKIEEWKGILINGNYTT